MVIGLHSVIGLGSLSISWIYDAYIFLISDCYRCFFKCTCL